MERCGFIRALKELELSNKSKSPRGRRQTGSVRARSRRQRGNAAGNRDQGSWRNSSGTATANGIHLEDCEIHVGSRSDKCTGPSPQKGAESGYPSQSLIYERAQKTFDVEHGWVAILDNKAGIALGFSGALLFAALVQTPRNCLTYARELLTSGAGGLSAAASLVFLIAVFGACVCLFQALRTRSYKYPSIGPDITVTKDDLKLDAADTALEYIKDIQGAVRSHQEIRKCRVRWYRAGMVCVGIALCSFAVYSWTIAPACEIGQ